MKNPFLLLLFIFLIGCSEEDVVEDVVTVFDNTSFIGTISGDRSGDITITVGDLGLCTVTLRADGKVFMNYQGGKINNEGVLTAKFNSDRDQVLGTLSLNPKSGSGTWTTIQTPADPITEKGNWVIP